MFPQPGVEGHQVPRVGVGLLVIVGVRVGVPVFVGVPVHVGVRVHVRVRVGVGVWVAVGVRVTVGEEVRVGVREEVDVRVGVGVWVAVGGSDGNTGLDGFLSLLQAQRPDRATDARITASGRFTHMEDPRGCRFGRIILRAMRRSAIQSTDARSIVVHLESSCQRREERTCRWTRPLEETALPS
jgi:hypothetical protein